MLFKLRKHIAIFIMTLVLFSSYIPTYAATTQNNEEVLTHKQALEMALKNSYELKNLELSSKKTTIEIDEALDNFGYALLDPQFLAAYKLDKTSSINSEKTKRMTEFINQGLDLKIKTSFYNINSIKNDIEIQKQRIQNEDKKKAILDLKYSYGMESKTNITSKTIEIEKMKAELDKLQKNLKDEYVSLNKVIGKNPLSTYNVENIIFEYSPIKDTESDIQSKIDKALAYDLTLWGKEQQSKLAQIDLDFYTMNFINGAPSNLQPSVSPYQSIEITNTLAGNDVLQTKDEIRNAVTSKYNTLKKLEIAYEELKLQMLNLNEKKRLLEVSIKVGSGINQDYNDLLLLSKELELGMEKVRSQHTLLRESYENPLLAGASF